MVDACTVDASDGDGEGMACCSVHSLQYTFSIHSLYILYTFSGAGVSTRFTFKYLSARAKVAASSRDASAVRPRFAAGPRRDAKGGYGLQLYRAVLRSRFLSCAQPRESPERPSPKATPRLCGSSNEPIGAQITWDCAQPWAAARRRQRRAAGRWRR